VIDELERRHHGASIQRLERGRYHFPDKPNEAGVQLTPGEFQMILDGIDLSRVRRFKRYSRP
jgi:transposase